jgi:hypothetical protein
MIYSNKQGVSPSGSTSTRGLNEKAQINDITRAYA